MSDPPPRTHRALGIVLLQGPRGGMFLMSEIPLYRTSGIGAGGRKVKVPLSSEYGTYTTVKARFWPCFQVKVVKNCYSGTSLVRNSAPLEPYSRNMPRPLWRSSGGGLFLMSEVPL